MGGRAHLKPSRSRSPRPVPWRAAILTSSTDFDGGHDDGRSIGFGVRFRSQLGRSKTPSTCAIIPATRVASILGRQVRTMNGEQTRTSKNPRFLYDCNYLLPPPNGNHSLFTGDRVGTQYGIQLRPDQDSWKDTAVTGGSLHEIDGTVAAEPPSGRRRGRWKTDSHQEGLHCLRDHHGRRHSRPSSIGDLNNQLRLLQTRCGSHGTHHIGVLTCPAILPQRCPIRADQPRSRSDPQPSLGDTSEPCGRYN